MPIGIDNVSVASTDNTGTAYTISHSTAGAQRGMLVLVSSTSQSEPSGITYAGTAMAKEIGAQEAETGKRASIWSLIQPGTGTNNVVISFPFAVAAAVTVMSMTDVDQANMVTASNGTTGNSTSPSLSIAADADFLVVDALTFDNSSATVGPGQTQRANHPAEAAGVFVKNAVSTEPGAASVTMSWSLSAAEPWVLAAVAVKPHLTPARMTLARCVIPLARARDESKINFEGWQQAAVETGVVTQANEFFTGFGLG